LRFIQAGAFMSRIDLSTQELFLRLGSTPRTRSARADSLFRRLRTEEAKEIAQSMFIAPSMPAFGKARPRDAK
jgi:hypothetical protein